MITTKEITTSIGDTFTMSTYNISNLDEQWILIHDNKKVTACFKVSKRSKNSTLNTKNTIFECTSKEECDAEIARLNLTIPDSKTNPMLARIFGPEEVVAPIGKIGTIPSEGKVSLNRPNVLNTPGAIGKLSKSDVVSTPGRIGNVIPLPTREPNATPGIIGVKPNPIPPVNNLGGKPVDKPVDKPIDKPIDKPVDKPVGKPVDKPIKVK